MRAREAVGFGGRVTAAVVLGGVLLSAQPAAASCAEGAGPDGSPVVFVGTAEDQRRGYTRFEVDEVWTGPDLAPEVWVRSGQDQPPWPLSLLYGVSSSIDADFTDGNRYVVGASRSFTTSVCSIAEATGNLHRADAREPVEEGAPGADPPIGPVTQTLGVVGVLAALAATVHLVRRRRKATS